MSAPLAKDVAEALRNAWLQHQVLVVRGQDITAEDQRRFTRCFGELQAPRSKIPRVNPDILYVANVSVDGDRGELPEGDMHFHADQCYYETLTAGAVLYAMEVPSIGGNTLFANMYQAYETLAPALRSRIDGLDVLFQYDYRVSAYKRGPVPTDAPRYVHPASIVHPYTGRSVLFVNRLMADSFPGIPRDESDALLEQLFEHIEQPEFIYEHEWRKGDVVIWDNFSTLHARTDFDPSERRILRRMAIRGAKPEGVRTLANA
ncbi:MAG: TauD/TfdA family dioxygenase [Betaproteobacteria bacterium]|nr:TauD/TfdA family dioxygenase [Betaproteobacteria bacterium]